MKLNKLALLVIFSAAVFGFGQNVRAATPASVATTQAAISTAGEGGIIKCGRGGSMCTLCDLISTMNTIIQYLMKISIGVALLAMAIGGVMYVVSAGDTGMIDNAKKTIMNAAVGFVIIFAAFLIIDTTINYLGAKKDPKTNASTFGMNITSWGQFECAARDRGGN